MAVDILAIGELLIDFVAEGIAKDVGHCSSFSKNAGGAPANVAVGARRLGLSSGFCGKVGADAFGRFLQDTLIGEGVDISGLKLDPVFRTTLAFVSLDADGDRSFEFFRHPGADMMLRADELDEAFISSCRVLQHGSISLISEPSAGATKTAVRLAREAKAAICLDINLRMALWDSPELARSAILQACHDADIIKASEEELLIVTGASNIKSAVSGIKESASPDALVVVTRGASGSFAYTGSFEVHEPGFSVNSIDTTGAGDGFLACFLSDLISLSEGASVRNTAAKLNAQELSRCLMRANAAGALCTTKRGAIPSLPTCNEIESLIRQRS